LERQGVNIMAISIQSTPLKDNFNSYTKDIDVRQKNIEYENIQKDKKIVKDEYLKTENINNKYFYNMKDISSIGKEKTIDVDIEKIKETEKVEDFPYSDEEKIKEIEKVEDFPSKSNLLKTVSAKYVINLYKQNSLY
jgi:hypothetical protein